MFCTEPPTECVVLKPGWDIVPRTQNGLGTRLGIGSSRDFISGTVTLYDVMHN